MTEKIEQKSEEHTTDVAPDANSALEMSNRSDIQREKSWGEKYKAGTYHFLRNQLTNYVINFIMAAILVYKFDTTKIGEKFRTWQIGRSAHLLDKYDIPEPLSKFVLTYFTKVQLMLCAGHVLLPGLTWMKNHRKRLEFRLGHMLDCAQEFFGRGNAASKNSLEEYDRVATLVSIGDHNRKQRDSIKPELSEEDKLLLAKNGLNEQLQFTDKKQPLRRVIIARLKGMFVTTCMGIAMGISSYLPWKALRFNETYERPFGAFIGKNLIPRIPVVRSVFKKDLIINGQVHTTGHALFGEYLLDEMIFTAGSKLGFDRAEAHYDKQEKAEERKERAMPSATQIRQKILAEGEKKEKFSTKVQTTKTVNASAILP